MADVVVAITGGSSAGIGRALAMEYARRPPSGARTLLLAVCGRNGAGLRATADETSQAARLAGHAVAVTVETASVDVADKAATHAWLSRIIRVHGHIDTIYANAALSGGTARRSGDDSSAASIGSDSSASSIGSDSSDATGLAPDMAVFRQLYDVNVAGVLNTVLPIVGHMRERRRGNIVFVGSPAGFLATSPYDVTKGAGES
jgi:NAD(P)-dependent dehydrogenase (short-subunit alcohol dehydrogenase family)